MSLRETGLAPTDSTPIAQVDSIREDSGADATMAMSVVDHLQARDEERIGGDRLLDLLT
jgi:hypothetical protein